MNTDRLLTCDMRGAPDTARERITAYRELAGRALVATESISGGGRVRLRAVDDTEIRVRELATLEQACCSFFTMSVTQHGDELWWDIVTPGDARSTDVAEALLKLMDPRHEAPNSAQLGDLGITILEHAQPGQRS